MSTVLVPTDLMRQVSEQEHRHDPYPLYAELRRHRVNVTEEGIYVIGRYDDVLALRHDPRISTDTSLYGEGTLAAGNPNAPFIRRDPPEHDRLRGIANHYYGPPGAPDYVRSLLPEIERLVTQAIDAFDGSGSGEIDLIDQFAYPLPVSMIAKMLGVPREDLERFHAWAEVIATGFGAQLMPNADELIQRGTDAAVEMAGYVRELIERLRRHPDSSMFSNLINGQVPHVMNDDELVASAVMLLIAGHETTVNLIGNGVLMLLRHPWAADRLRREPGWAPLVVEEMLRMEPPVQYHSYEYAVTDVAVGDVVIPRGANIYLLVAAANRDPGRFADPDRFDPDRPDNQHLSFGSGIHYCFGAPMARLEVQVALTALFTRVDGLEVIDDPPPYRSSPVLRGPSHLRLRHEGVRAAG
ncbi:MAG: cytochrome P450 [Acidimicrobiales bacterium]